jgi:hypothetical protein
MLQSGLDAEDDMTYDALIEEPHLRGFITELDFDRAEEEFPGITSFYEHCRRKPTTFLDLLWQFEDALAAAPKYI